MTLGQVVVLVMVALAVAALAYLEVHSRLRAKSHHGADDGSLSGERQQGGEAPPEQRDTDALAEAFWRDRAN